MNPRITAARRHLVSTQSSGGRSSPLSRDSRASRLGRFESQMTLRRALTLISIAVCASTLVGCAGGDTLSLDPVARAADSTSKLQSSRFEFRATLDAGSIASLSFDGNGIFD